MNFIYAFGMDLSLGQLRIVDAIAREGGAGAASRRLRLTQPAVSHALRKLEDHLGMKLFDRAGRGMAPTDAGRRVADAARDVLADLDRLRFDLEQLRQDQQGTLRVVTQCYTCYRWLPSVIRRFRSEYPGFDVRIVPDAAEHVVEALRGGDVEIAITHSRIAAPDLRDSALFRDELLAILPPGHPLTDRDRLEPSDFSDQVVIFHSKPEDSALTRRFLAPAGVRPREVLCLQLTTAVVEAVRAGLGITVLANWVAAPELAAGTLVGRSLGDGGLYRDWCVTTRADHAERPAVAAFARLINSEPSLRQVPPPG